MQQRAKPAYRFVRTPLKMAGRAVHVLKKQDKDIIRDFLLITAGCLALVAGNYFFKFPNHFVFGGVTGIAVLIATVIPYSVGTINLVINCAFLLLGFLILGRKFGVRTVYATALMAVSLSVLEIMYPMKAPFTGQLMLEFSISILLTAFGSAVLFYCEASSGGTDIVAMILKKYTGNDIGWMLLISDCIIVIAAFFVFDIQTALFSSLGLLIKSMVIDRSISQLKRCRLVNIICDKPENICNYIIQNIHRDATFYEATGAYSQKKKFIIICVLRPKQEIILRRFIRDHEPSAFVLVSDSSLIFGKGFSDFS